MRYSLDNATEGCMNYFLLEEQTGILRTKDTLDDAPAECNVST